MKISGNHRLLFLFTIYSGLITGGICGPIEDCEFFVNDEICPDLSKCYSSCGCNLGQCSLDACENNCGCDGGGCSMPKCGSNCSCKGGGCDMAACVGPAWTCTCEGGNCSGPLFDTPEPATDVTSAATVTHILVPVLLSLTVPFFVFW